MEWKVVLFDFDDTLFLKTTYDMVPGIVEILKTLIQQNIVIGIITYNHRANSILEQYELDKYFTFITHVRSKTECKSTVFKTNPYFINMKNKRDILFFDNDPFNIYDMSRLGLTCFLVNPINGICKNTMINLLQHNYKLMQKQLIEHLNRVYNYVERTTYTQNLSQVELLILNSI
jgi:FMN phosphatase YigB (HAD superfamily)